MTNDNPEIIALLRREAEAFGNCSPRPSIEPKKDRQHIMGRNEKIAKGCLPPVAKVIIPYAGTESKHDLPAKPQVIDEFRADLPA